MKKNSTGFKTKRKLWKITSLLLVLVIAFTGCSNGSSGTDKDKGEKGTQSTGNKGAKSTTEGTTAAAKEKLTIALQTDSFVTDYKDNYLTKFLENELGIDIEIYELPTDRNEALTKLSLMVSGGDSLPDVFLLGGISSEVVLDYGSKGVFIPLNDYVNDASTMPNFNAIPEEDRNSMLESSTSADGNIYSLTQFEPQPWNQTPYRFYINQAWLTKLGLEIPRTTDEYYEVLKAFVNNDPNENGIKDEIAVYGLAQGGYGEDVCTGLMNSFVFYNRDLALSEDGQAVIAPYVTDEFKDGLEYLKKLYDEGLLTASVFTDDSTQMKAILNNETANIVGSLSIGSYSAWTDVNTNKNFQEMTIMAPLTGPKGVNYTPYSEYTPSPLYYITSSCKNPDLAIKLGDLFYREDVGITARYCEQGVDWSADPEVTAKYTNQYIEKGLYDKVSFVYFHNYWSENTNKFWKASYIRYAPTDQQNASVDAGEQSALKSTLQSFNYQYYYDKHPEHILPALKYTLEESEAVTEMKANIPDYVQQSMAEFITGARSLNDWDNYKKELDRMGLQEYIKTAQAAYDRTK